MREHFRALAREAPGFAGIYVDDAGELVISAAGADLSPGVRGAVARWLAANGRADLANKAPKLNRVKHDYAELTDFLEQVKQRALGGGGGVHGFRIDDRTGKVVVGVEDDRVAQRVRASVADLALASDAFAVEVEPEIRDLGLQDQQFSAMHGGIQLMAPSGGTCSVGLVGFRNSDGAQVFTTAAHCTTSQYAMQSDTFGQPTLSRPAGKEIAKAPLYPQGVYPCTGSAYPYCRDADVALLQVEPGVSSWRGYAAKSSATSVGANPPYLGYQAVAGSGVVQAIVGETVTKVGRTTGQTSGRIEQACVDRQSSVNPDIWTLCAQMARLNGDRGDSGAPVFIPQGGAGSNPSPRTAGVLFQGGGGIIYLSAVGGVDLALGRQYTLAF